uniref:Uncharacterized protein n=1 Tax=Human herpesvirus 2 TaxID=10310 RepID=A0A481TTZ6_HHV2|nr:hypothetical protein [Human alphaherpesvirus 2]
MCRNSDEVVRDMATYALFRRRFPGVKHMATLSRLSPWERVMVIASLELMP